MSHSARCWHLWRPAQGFFMGLGKPERLGCRSCRTKWAER